MTGQVMANWSEGLRLRQFSCRRCECSGVNPQPTRCETDKLIPNGEIFDFCIRRARRRFLLHAVVIQEQDPGASQRFGDYYAMKLTTPAMMGQVLSHSRRQAAQSASRSQLRRLKARADNLRAHAQAGRYCIENTVYSSRWHLTLTRKL